MIGRQPTTSPLVEEYRIYHTPVIGAFMFWTFAQAYVEATLKTGNGRNPHFLLFCFLAAFLSDRRLLNEVARKQSIVTFRRHLKKEKKGILFDGIHTRVREMLPYTLAALDICYASGILKLHADDATIEPINVRGKKGISKKTHEDALLAATLGRWFAKCRDVNDVARKLEVVL